MSMNCREVKEQVKKRGLLPSLEIDYYKCFSDEELVKKFVSKDEEGAFNELVERHADKIMRTAYRITRDQTAAEEVLQNVFLILTKSLSGFRNDSKFTTWLYRVVVNTSYMYLREKNKVDRSEMLIEDIVSFDESGNLKDVHMKDWSEVPEGHLLNEESSSVLENAIDDLPKKYRVVFQLKDVEGMSNQEVADTLNLSLPAVKSRALRARLFLRDMLSDYYSEYMEN